jgi:hypothetical protein
MFARFQHSTESSATRRGFFKLWVLAGKLRPFGWQFRARRVQGRHVNGYRTLGMGHQRGQKRMGARRSKGKKEGRTPEMYDTIRGGPNRPSDNAWAWFIERTPAIPGLIGFRSNFLDVLETSCLERTRGALR